MFFLSEEKDKEDFLSSSPNLYERRIRYIKETNAAGFLLSNLLKSFMIVKGKVTNSFILLNSSSQSFYLSLQYLS